MNINSLNKTLKNNLSPLRWLVLLGGFLLIANAVGAQQYLTVRNQNRPKRFRFDYGDFIGVKMENDRHLYKGEIEGFNDSTLFLAGTALALDKIRVFKDYRWQDLTGSIVKSAFYTIPFFLISGALVGYSGGFWQEPAFYMSGLYAIIAAVTYPIKGRRFKMGNRWKMMVVNPYPN